MQSIINGLESCYDQTWALGKFLKRLIPLEDLSSKQISHFYTMGFIIQCIFFV